MRTEPRTRPIVVLLLAALVATVLGTAAAQDPGDDPVVLRAGAYTETRSDFDLRFEAAMRNVAAQQGMELTDELRAELAPFAPSFLEQRAQEVALLRAADRRGVTADEEAVDAVLDEIRGQFGDDPEAFLAGIRQAGFDDEADLRATVQEAESIDALVRALEAEIDLSEQEVRTAYLADRERFRTGDQVCARHILLEAEAEAEAVLADLEAGADFGDAAREHTVDPSGVETGGDLGCFGRGRMVPAFEEAVFAAEVGVPTGPVASDFGHHLILVEERQEGGFAPFADVEADLRDELVQDRIGAAIGRIVELSGVTVYPERLGVPAPPATAPEADD